MKPAPHNIFGISKQRGIWLRCFLDADFASIWNSRVLKGHDFRRAEQELERAAALATGLVKGTGFSPYIRLATEPGL